jgi:hypothetical protein
MYRVVVLVLLLVFGLAWGIAAQVPARINYQMRLTNSASGEPRSGLVTVVFSLYDDPDGGNLLWTETRTVEADSGGVAHVILGKLNPLEISFSDPVWLQLEVDGEPVSPRRELASVPYAFRSVRADSALWSDLAGDSEGLGGEPSSSYVLRGESGSITVDMVVQGGGSGFNADMVDSFHAEAFAETAHNHDQRYFTHGDLRDPGTINSPDNPVDWTRLKNVPADFADGSDDVGGSGAGDGHSLDAADGDPIDVVYVSNNGKVGIGLSAAPVAKLDVDGSVNSSSAYEIAGETVFTTQVGNHLLLGVGAGGNNSGGNVLCPIPTLPLLET